MPDGAAQVRDNAQRRPLPSSLANIGHCGADDRVAMTLDEVI